MSKHTPGPWGIVGGQYGLPEVWKSDRSEAVCERVFNGNARLIAAAPELLDALEAVVRADIYMHERADALAKARAAIAKATGE